METLIYFLVIFSLISSGMIAGIFFAFSNFVMPALSAISDYNGLVAMQSINKKVLNPLFFVFFLGNTATTLILIVLFFTSHVSSVWVFIGALFYFFGCFLVTGTRNVPLNNQIDILNPDETESHRTWSSYIQSWTLWNHIRTIASFVSMVCFIVYLIVEQ